MTFETWKDIEGYDGLYSISSMGRLRLNQNINRYKCGLYQNMPINQDGYIRVSLTKDKARKKVFLHVLVASAFLGAKPDGCEINHKDGNKENNAADNLEYVTHHQNMQHAIVNGLWSPKIKGKHPRAKFSDQQVVEIKSMYASGMSSTVLGKHFNVSHQTILNMVNGYTYKEVTS